MDVGAAPQCIGHCGAAPTSGSGNAFPLLPGRRKRPHSTSTPLPPLRGRSRFRGDITKYLPLVGPPLHLAGYFADDFFVGDVTFDGGLTDEEEGCADDER
jgi:hypothetical protein